MEEKFKTKNDTKISKISSPDMSYISTLMALNMKFGKSFMFTGKIYLHTHLVA